MSALTVLTDRPPVFLRRALVLDAVASGATGLMMIAGAGLVEGLLGLPAALLRGAGIVLMPYVAFVIYAGTRETIARPAVWAIIVANALWAAASAFLLVSGWVAPTALGTAFVIAQAVVVALLGELQYVGLRRGVNRPMATA
jgi:glucose uptake protein GlcU